MAVLFFQMIKDLLDDEGVVYAGDDLEFVAAVFADNFRKVLFVQQTTIREPLFKRTLKTFQRAWAAFSYFAEPQYDNRKLGNDAFLLSYFHFANVIFLALRLLPRVQVLVYGFSFPVLKVLAFN